MTEEHDHVSSRADPVGVGPGFINDHAFLCSRVPPDISFYSPGPQRPRDSRSSRF